MSEAEIRRNLWDRAANTWRRLVDSATIEWTTTTPGQASAGVVDGSIDTTQLADDAVTTDKIEDDAVTLAKLADDAYAIGTWTPVLTFETPGNLSVVYSVQSGRFTKIGRMVFADFVIVTSTFTHSSASGDCQITGLQHANAAGISQRGYLHFQGITKANYTQFTVRVPTAGSLLVVEASGSAQAESDVAAADMPTGGTVILAGAIIYIA